RKKNAQTGQWEDVPVFLDVEAFNRGEFGKTADLVEQYLRKGHQAFIEGHLRWDQWTTQEGQKRDKLKIVVDNVQFLERRSDGEGPRPRSPPRRQASTGGAPPRGDEGGGYEPPPSEPEMPSPPPGRGEGEIPF